MNNGVYGQYWHDQLSDLIARVHTHDMIASNQISLLAGSTTVSKTVFELMNTDLLTRGAEGRGKNIHLPGLAEFYKIEGLAEQEVAKVFNADFAELRPVSGSQANMIVLAALTDIGDTILTPSISDGGHISTSGRLVRNLKNYKFIHPPLVKRSFRLDMDAFIELVRQEKPKVIFFGGSVIIEAQCLKNLVEVSHEHGAIVVFDASHVAGLIATGSFPNPMADGVDLMTMTTCKTIPGPPHAWIVGQAALEDSIRKTVFPGFVSGGHLQEYVGAIAALYELMAFGEEYGRVVIQTANLLGEALEKAGFSVVRTAKGRVTDTHQVLCEGHSVWSAEQVEHQLEDIGILANSNYLPKNGGFSKKKGVRFGTQEAVWLGMRETETLELAEIITGYLNSAEPDIESYRQSVAGLRSKLRGFGQTPLSEEDTRNG